MKNFKISDLELTDNIRAFLYDSFKIQEIKTTRDLLILTKRKNFYQETIYLAIDNAFVDVFEDRAIYHSAFIPETLIKFSKEFLYDFVYTFSLNTIYRFLKLYSNPQIPQGVITFLDWIYYCHNYCNNIHDFKFNYYYNGMTDNMKRLAAYYEEKRKKILEDIYFD